MLTADDDKRAARRKSSRSHPPRLVISGFENQKSNRTASKAAFEPDGPFGPKGRPLKRKCPHWCLTPRARRPQSRERPRAPSNFRARGETRLECRSRLGGFSPGLKRSDAIASVCGV